MNKVKFLALMILLGMTGSVCVCMNEKKNFSGEVTTGLDDIIKGFDGLQQRLKGSNKDVEWTFEWQKSIEEKRYKVAIRLFTMIQKLVILLKDTYVETEKFKREREERFNEEIEAKDKLVENLREEIKQLKNKFKITS